MKKPREFWIILNKKDPEDTPTVLINPSKKKL